MKMLIILFIMVVLMASFVVAEQTVKTVEYPVGYIPQTVAGNDYTKNLNVQSPDGISDILSLEIKLTGDFQANTGVSARTDVGGSLVSCEPSSWTTPNMDAPSYEVSFDCTDLINTYDWKGGSQQFGFRTDKIAQNIYGTMKITYYNQPKVSMSVFGTEYQVGDAGTSFIQLLDDERQAINDASCYIDAYYPNKTILWEDEPLIYQLNSDGLYYKEFTAPNVIGLYMLSSACYIPADAWTDAFNNYDYISEYENIIVSGGVAKISDPPSVDYRWATTSPSCPQIIGSPDGLFTNIISSCIGEDFSLSGMEVTDILPVQIFYSWRIPQVLLDDYAELQYCYDSAGCTTWNTWKIYNSTNTPFTKVPAPYDNFTLGSLNYTQVDNLRLRLVYTKLGGADSQMEIDAVGIKILFPQTPIEEGYLYSEEIDLSNESAGWQTFSADYSNNSGTITFGIVNASNDTICTGLGNIETCADSQTPIRLFADLSRTGNGTSPTLNDWTISWLVNGTIREVKGAGEIHISDYVNEINTNIDAVAEDVWSYNGTINLNIIAQFVNAIWSYSGSIVANILNQVSDTIWTRADRNLTFYEDVTNYTEIQNIVVQYGNDDVANYTYIQELIVAFGNDDVTNYTLIEELIVEFGNNNTDLTNYTQIQNLVAQYGNEDNANYTLIQDLISQYSNNLTSGDVWEYGGDRNLTYYPSQTDLTNYSLISEMVWENIDRSLTEFNFTVDINETLVSESVWSAINRSLTEFPDLVNENEIADTVWNYVSRNLTYTPAYPNPNNLTASQVWSYATRDLTYYPAQQNITINGTDIASQVWNYGGVISTNILDQVADKVQCYLNEILEVDDGEWGIDISAC